MAYRVRVWQTTFYLHDRCHKKAIEENVNNLPLVQIERDRKFFVQVPSNMVPDGYLCSMPGCWKPIREECD